MIKNNELISDVFTTVPVDETRTVEDELKEIAFDWVNNDITSINFPVHEDGKSSEKEIFLFNFERKILGAEVIAEMDKAGYRPATVWELIGLVQKEPNLPKQFPLVALGSVCKLNGDYCVVHLSEQPSFFRMNLYLLGRDWYKYLKTFTMDACLDLDSINREWTSRHRFLGVPK
jgi:hypothetical protein